METLTLETKKNRPESDLKNCQTNKINWNKKKQDTGGKWKQNKRKMGKWNIQGIYGKEIKIIDNITTDKMNLQR